MEHYKNVLKYYFEHFSIFIILTAICSIKYINITNTALVVSLSYIVFFSICEFKFKRNGTSLIHLAKFKKISIQELLLIILSFILFSLVSGFIVNLVVHNFKDYNITSNFINESLSTYLSLICITVFMPISEEILMRGLIFNELKSNLNLSKSLIIQAMIFALSHGSILQIIYTFTGGIVYGLIYLWTDSIIAPIIAHITFNITGTIILSMLFLYIKEHIYVYIFLGTLLMLISMSFLYKFSKCKKTTF
ncbi:CPBP family intramembrane glutamic endopeptidase [Clostridium lundense]|uniref:CPBP family intramembrane glutamic endopeptidase n=1 Tax=Clostridium lundense TaxID=319475 RepID=UPI000480025F|nr:CPBP family intramembrane glutamic endopeptidase [Clostridium lundense]